MKHLILFLAIFLCSCGGETKFIEHKESYVIDSVEYLPIGVPSVANVDPRWIAHTKMGKFTYYHPVEAGDSVQVIIMQKDTSLFSPIIDHSEIK
jgi:hypothetical protein